MAVGVEVCLGVMTIVAVRVPFAANVGEVWTATWGTSCRRRRKLLTPRQYRSSAKVVMTVRRLYRRFCETVS